MTDIDALADEFGIPDEDRAAVADMLGQLNAPADLLMGLVRLVRADDDVTELIAAITALSDADMTEMVLVVAVLLLSDSLPDPLPDAPPEAP